MVANSLRDDLLGIPGVEGAEVEGSTDAPAGLRIRIAEGADQQAVGGAIRRVLGSHGLGTDTRLPGEPPASGKKASEPAAVAVLAPAEDVERSAEDEAEDEEPTVVDLTDDKISGEDQDDSGERPSSRGPEAWKNGDLPPFVKPREPRVDTRGDVSEPVAAPARDIVRIERVAVEEGRSGIVVTVGATDGSETSQAASSSEGGVESAVVKAAARLVNPNAPDPIVVDIEDRRVEGVDAVMIVLEIDGELVTGSAIVAAGRVFALGRATWAALAL